MTAGEAPQATGQVAAPGAPLWGVAAEFAAAPALLAAVRAARAADLGRVDAYSPHPVPGVEEALRLRPRPATPVAVAGALMGGAAMFAFCAYASMIAYPLDIGGRPRFSWPSFVVPSVSFAMLVAAVAAVLAMLVLSRLPRLNHPAFNIEGMTRATQDRFFVAIEASDDRFDAAMAEAVFTGLADAPLRVTRVPR